MSARVLVGEEAKFQKFRVTMHDSMDEDENADKQEIHDSTGPKVGSIENEPELPQATSVGNALDFRVLPPMKLPSSIRNRTMPSVIPNLLPSMTLCVYCFV